MRTFGSSSRMAAPAGPRSAYDRIIVTAAAAQLPEAFFEQLCEGGVLVIPIGDRETQELQSIRKIGGKPQATVLSGCRFVPLVGAFEPS